MTNKERCCRSFTEDPNYSLCGEGIEDINHIFRSCGLVREV